MPENLNFIHGVLRDILNSPEKTQGRQKLDVYTTTYDIIGFTMLNIVATIGNYYSNQSIKKAVSVRNSRLTIITKIIIIK